MGGLQLEAGSRQGRSRAPASPSLGIPALACSSCCDGWMAQELSLLAAWVCFLEERTWQEGKALFPEEHSPVGMCFPKHEDAGAVGAELLLDLPQPTSLLFVPATRAACAAEPGSSRRDVPSR